jgi:hypothetical protein
MENFAEVNLEQKTIQLDENGISQLSATRKWTMFLSIVGFVFLALMLIVMIGLLGFNNALLPSGASTLTFIPLLILGLVYLIPIYFIYQFSNYSRQAILRSDSRLLSLSLKYLKMHYRFMGILLIIVLSIYFLVGVGLLISGKLFDIF